MKIMIGVGRLFRYGNKTLHGKDGEDATKFVCTYTNIRKTIKGGWTTDYHNIYMPMTEEFYEKFYDATSYEMLKNGETAAKDIVELTDIVIAQGEFSCNSYAGKGSTTIYATSPNQVAVIRRDSEWFNEPEAVLLERFVTYGPAGFEEDFDEGGESDG